MAQGDDILNMDLPSCNFEVTPVAQDQLEVRDCRTDEHHSLKRKVGVCVGSRKGKNPLNKARNELCSPAVEEGEAKLVRGSLQLEVIFLKACMELEVFAIDRTDGLHSISALFEEVKKTYVAAVQLNFPTWTSLIASLREQKIDTLRTRLLRIMKMTEKGENEARRQSGIEEVQI